MALPLSRSNGSHGIPPLWCIESQPMELAKARAVRRHVLRASPFMDIRSFVELCDVENNFCFLPREGLTFCNCYAKVVLASQDIYLPNMKASDIYEWLMNHSCWSLTPSPEIAVAVVKHMPHGHIAVRVEDSVWTSAGAKNHKFCTLKQAFGSLTPTIFYHIK